MSEPFTSLSSDLIELILSSLPIPSLLRASSVCKLWHSLITAPTFPSHPPHHRPWFFLHGLHNTSSKNNQSFAFDPSSNSWFRLPYFPFPSRDFIGSNGFLFSTAASFSFSPVLKPRWKSTSPLSFSRINPLVGVFLKDNRLASSSCYNISKPHFIVVGGVRFIGNLVDIEDRLAVEIYDPGNDSWDLCPPLPADFRSGNSSQTLSSALLKSRFYVFGIYTFFVSFFDLDKHVWSQVQTLRPPGVLFAFLIACQEMLVLAGMCNGPQGPSFNLWKIGEKNMEFSEIAIMPQDLLYGLVDSEEDDKFASLKCVGMGNLVYVFNEEYHCMYPACICQIFSETGKCSWKRVPQLPSPVNKFHKVISFCSMVLLQHVFLDDEEELEIVLPMFD
ncbi:F-box/kelch-repeat protein At3g24760 [Ricinus communis]|uniref:F-box domain-containing protein n=1 Tax=Ricinus communis TaxID=3988 RepID=B9S548_RICCO|nr:F-box/kelch-repeat protein At3g24760 [Ricinus communis]EEF41268.1 conserved hypothetical protein [Ricinus communis]|eukprot:XP_002521117.1 F-box/kelch-repeat protein At3g24760 [Ricinus communis]